jgi:hypothetical protein
MVICASVFFLMRREEGRIIECATRNSSAPGNVNMGRNVFLWLMFPIVGLRYPAGVEGEHEQNPPFGRVTSSHSLAGRVIKSARPVKSPWVRAVSMAKITVTHGHCLARQIDRHKLQSYQLMASVKRTPQQLQSPHIFHHHHQRIVQPPPTSCLTIPKETSEIVEASVTIITASPTIKYTGFEKVSTLIPSVIGNTDDVGHVLPRIP